MARPKRRLSVIVAIDAVDSTTMIQRDELGTLGQLRSIYRALARPTLGEFGASIIKVMGDGGLIEFPSVLDAVEWTMRFQTAMAKREASMREAAERDPATAQRPIRFRAAIVLADIIVADNDRYGAAIAFAARMQEVAPPGGIAITHSVRWQLIGGTGTAFKPAGNLRLRSVPYLVEAWMWAPEGVELPEPGPMAAQSVAPMAEDIAPQRDTRPLVMVLPFATLGAQETWVADGIVEETTTTLGRIRDIRMVARHIAYTHVDRGEDLRALGRSLGLRYAVEGSVRQAGTRLRVTVGLVDAETGASLWSERVDGTLDDVFALQDSVARHVAGALHPSVRAAEITRARSKSVGMLRARDIVLTALPYFWAHRREDNATAVALFDKALAVDARHALALGLKAWCLGQGVIYVWSDDPSRDRIQALDLVDRAARANEPDPLVLTAIGATLSILDRDQARALTYIERALALDPTFAWAWTRAGYAHAYSGRQDEALRCFETAVGLSPEDPVLFNAYAGMATSHFLAGDDRASMRWASTALRDRPDMVWARRVLAAAAAHAGEIEIARDTIRRLLEIQPGLTLRSVAAGLHNIGGTAKARYLEGLRLAGLPEGAAVETLPAVAVAL